MFVIMRTMKGWAYEPFPIVVQRKSISCGFFFFQQCRYLCTSLVVPAALRVAIRRSPKFAGSLSSQAEQANVKRQLQAFQKCFVGKGTLGGGLNLLFKHA